MVTIPSEIAAARRVVRFAVTTVAAAAIGSDSAGTSHAADCSSTAAA